MREETISFVIPTDDVQLSKHGNKLLKYRNNSISTICTYGFCTKQKYRLKLK